MPDGPRYKDDFYAWTRYQAEVLRTLRTRDNRFDRENVVEEIETVGRNERDAVRSQVRRVLVHFLKLAHSPARDPRFGWMGSIVEARAQLADKLSPSLHRDIDEILPRLYSDARKLASLELLEHGEHGAAQSLPAECPFTTDQILAEDWYPAPPERANGDSK
jgi:Domain of unknown function DUF29